MVDNNRVATFPLFSAFLLAFTLVLMSPHGLAEEEYDEVFTAAELDQMLAPVALYPDALLSQILMAATYPLEVVEAARWSAANPRLDGAEAVDAVEDMNWDPSVKALVAFPELLARMDDNLQWTQRMGDAYLIQEEDVIDAIQRLREEAYAAGHLNDMQYARAWRERGIIIIEPVSPQVVYVPYYHPATIYHHWWRPVYPSFYWGSPPGYHSGVSFYWGRGIHIAPLFFYSTFHWHDRHIVIVDRHHYRPHYSGGNYHQRFDNAWRWSHDPRHRRGVSYSHRGLHEQYRHYNASREGFGRERDMRDRWRDSHAWQRGDYREDRVRNDSHRSDSHRSDNHRGDSHRSDSRRDDSRQWDSARPSERRDRDQQRDDHRAPGTSGIHPSQPQAQDRFQQDRPRQDQAGEREQQSRQQAREGLIREDRSRQERSLREVNRNDHIPRGPSAREIGGPAMDARQRSVDARASSQREAGYEAFSSRSASPARPGAERMHPEVSREAERSYRNPTPPQPERAAQFQPPRTTEPQTRQAVSQRQAMSQRQEVPRSSERPGGWTGRDHSGSSLRGMSDAGNSGDSARQSPRSMERAAERGGEARGGQQHER